MRSPIIMVVTLVLARMQSGMMEASTTRRPSKSVDPAVLVHDRHRVACRPHLAGAGDVLTGGRLAQHPLVQGIVRFDDLVRWSDPLGQDVVKFRMPRQLYGKSQTLPRAAPVELFGKVVVVEMRLDSRIFGRERQLASPCREHDTNPELNSNRRRPVSASFYAFGPEVIHNDYHIVSQVRSGCGVPEHKLASRR